MKLTITRWEEMPVGVYMELQELCGKNADIEPENVEIGIVGLLCGVEEDDVLSLPISEFQELRRQAQFVSTWPEITAKCPKRITINGTVYSVCRDAGKMSTAQYIDFQSYSSQSGVGFLPYVLTCFLVPEGKEYAKDYDIDKVVADIKDYLPIVTAYEMCAFFLRKYLASIMATLRFSESMMRKTLRRERDPEKRRRITETMEAIRSLRNGDGLMPFAG